MTESTNAEFCTVGKYLSEKSPMIHQRRIIDSFVLIYGGIEENCTFPALFDAKREQLQDLVHRLLFA